MWVKIYFFKILHLFNYFFLTEIVYLLLFKKIIFVNIQLKNFVFICLTQKFFYLKQEVVYNQNTIYHVSIRKGLT